jgi:SAM-dependent methyltransferase
MYGDNYGYRSGLNESMVAHLAQKTRTLEQLTGLSSGDTVLDIGCNDGTLLRSYATSGLHRVGIDPTATKFRQYYPDDIALIPEFFSAESFRRASSKAAEIVTSIAMFYDLQDPIAFAKQVASVMAADGVWHFEQSYMPSMLRMNSYDTICHEHVEYYSLGVVTRILAAADLEVVDVLMNGVNGGSFAVTACKRSSKKVRRNRAVIDWLLQQEDSMALNTPRPYRDFEERVFRHRLDLRRLIDSLIADGKTILGYGASTKGNVVLQFCGLGPDKIRAIGEINREKFGRVTPGTHIPIISEDEARRMQPDYFLVLPWHFKEGILRRERDFIARGGRLIFPFPEIEIV